MARLTASPSPLHSRSPSPHHSRSSPPPGTCCPRCACAPTCCVGQPASLTRSVPAGPARLRALGRLQQLPARRARQREALLAGRRRSAVQLLSSGLLALPLLRRRCRARQRGLRRAVPRDVPLQPRLRARGHRHRLSRLHAAARAPLLTRRHRGRVARLLLRPPRPPPLLARRPAQHPRAGAQGTPPQRQPPALPRHGHGRRRAVQQRRADPRAGGLHVAAADARSRGVHAVGEQLLLHLRGALLPAMLHRGGGRGRGEGVRQEHQGLAHGARGRAGESRRGHSLVTLLCFFNKHSKDQEEPHRPSPAPFPPVPPSRFLS